MSCRRGIEKVAACSICPGKHPYIILGNFVWMAVCLTTLHGCVTSVIAIASAELGDLGSFQTGTLYGFYTVTLLLTPSIVDFFGVKWTLVLSLAVYLAYIASNMVTKAYSIIPGAALGGVGAGTMWTAQGAYFVANAWEYAEAKGYPRIRATAFFGAVWVVIYNLVEVSIHLASSAIHHNEWKHAELLLYIVLTGLSVFATVGMTLVKPYSKADYTADKPAAVGDAQETRKDTAKKALIEDNNSAGTGDNEFDDENPKQQRYEQKKGDEEIGVAARKKDDDASSSSKPDEHTPLLCSSKGGMKSVWLSVWNSLVGMAVIMVYDPRIALTIPFNFAFGVISSLTAHYINGTVISEALGKENINYLAGISGAVQGVSAVIFGLICRYSGKKAPVAQAVITQFGAFLYLIVTILFLWGDAKHETGWAPFVIIYCVLGVANAVWSGTFMALYGDLFGYATYHAFAHYKCQSGIASTICFFVFPELKPDHMLWIALVVSGMAVFTNILIHFLPAPTRPVPKELRQSLQ